MEYSLLLFGAAVHWDNPAAYEEVAEYRSWNPGLGVQLSWVDKDEGLLRYRVAAGAYQNSLDRLSVFAGPGISYGSRFGFDLSLVYMTGYVGQPQPVVPLVGAFARVTDDLTLHAVYMGAGVGAYLEYRL
jgi:hypothetical protein